MHRRLPNLIFGLVLVFAAASPAQAARPILDYHRLDAYFALYAHDTNVPWKPATVRLDTFTSAPVDFSVYQVDPADVIVAGANTRPRAIDAHRLHPIATWRYSPPGGYRFQSNDVDVPLGSRQGFFVVEARRGDVGEQVWINRTRIGLLSKETPSGILLYGTDLGSGEPLSHMRVSFIAGGRFVDRYTGRDGIAIWRNYPRPVFALAQWGDSSAFLSFLPQAPLPGTIVGVKTDTAVVHAGDELHVVGFARSRSGERLRPASGVADVTLRSYTNAVARTSMRLDAAGAFSASLPVPPQSRAGDYTVMATVNGATAGTSVHVDADAGGLSLKVFSQCGTCDPDQDVPMAVQALRNGAPASDVDVDVDIIRSPHAYAVESDIQPWGIAEWYAAQVRTGGDGRAVFRIPHPEDGLASTYGVRVESGGATADTRITVPTGAQILRITVDHEDIGAREPAVFDVYTTDASTGKPAAGVPVRVQLVHGSSIQEQTVNVDDRGHVHGAFSDPQPGSNLIVAAAGRAMDAAQVMVEPQTMRVQDSVSSSVAVSLDRKRYASGDEARVSASLSGAQGAGLLTLETPSGTQARVVQLHGSLADTSFKVNASSGALAAGAAFVHDGELEWTSAPLVVDGPGRPISAPLVLDKPAYQPGADAIAHLDGIAPGTGTLVVRITKDAPTGSAFFATAPDLLEVGTTATQDSAMGIASWHPGVDSTGEHPLVQSFLRRSAPPADLMMTQADTASVYWKVDRASGDSTEIPVPQTPGTYHLSLLKIDDDGRVAAGSGDLVVQ